MIADMEPNKKLKPIVAELFMRGRKLNVSVVFISQCYFAVSKTIRSNVMYYFITKIRTYYFITRIRNKGEL